MKTDNAEEPDIFRSIEHLRGEYVELLLYALKDGLSAVSTAKDTGRYIGNHYDFPTLSFHQNGLPYLSSTIGSGPTDYRNCFTSIGTPPLINEDKIHSFNDLVAFVRSNEALHRRFTIDVNLNSEKGLISRYDKFFITSGVIDCVERYIYQFNKFEYDKDNAIVAIAPTVAYLFERNLNIDISVPILFLDFEFDNYQIADGICIERISDAEHKARYKVKSFNTSAHQNVINSATHALVIKGWCVPNSECMWHFDILSKARAYPIELIDQFFGAMRIANPVDTGYAQVYAVAKGWEADCTANLPFLLGATVRSYPTFFEDYHWNLEKIPMISEIMINEVKLIFNHIRCATENSINLALKRLNRCLVRDEEEDAVLDATIALEALLSDGNQEMTYKLALRVGALSKLDKSLQNDSVQAFNDLKSIYRYRSAIVHGSKNLDRKRIIKITQETNTTAHALAVEYLRMILRVLLLNEEYRDPKHIDEKLLLGAEHIT